MPRIVLITGVTRGLGRAAVDECIRAGCTVWGCGRSVDAIRELQRTYGGPHRFSAVDVCDEDQVARWRAELTATGDGPDLVLNNAAVINHSAPLWTISSDEFAHVMDMNLKGVFHVVRQFVPVMANRGGVIVNFSSGWGRSTAAGVAPYCATKWGIEGLTRALADELPDGLAAVAVNPGVIDTDMLRRCFGEVAGH